MDLNPEICELCPRKCGVNRAAGRQGVCGADDRLLVARAALHFWEEPPISGETGSGTIFFTHCPLHCSYCQNTVIAHGETGRSITVKRLADMCLDLQAQGAMNVNMVTPTHYAPHIRAAVREARERGLSLPIVWNTGGYETIEAVRANVGTVDVYLTDFKYADPALGRRYSNVSDYPQRALEALEAMVDALGAPRYDRFGESDRIVSGVIVRHLLLPGCLDDSARVVRMLHERFGSSIRLSIMNQYTPVLSAAAASGNARARETLGRCPELGQTVSSEEYEALLDFADSIGVEDYFWQEGGACEESFIPPFDCTGV